MANDEDTSAKEAEEAPDRASDEEVSPAKNEAPAAVRQPKAARAEAEPAETDGSFVSSAIVIALALAAAIGFLSLTR